MLLRRLSSDYAVIFATWYIDCFPCTPITFFTEF
jgi:hypothetical protein